METVSVEIPFPPGESLTLAGLRDIVGGFGGKQGSTGGWQTAGDASMLAERVMLPENLLRLARVIVKLVEEPFLMLWVVGLEPILKSTTLATIVVWCTSPPLVGVMVNV